MKRRLLSLLVVLCMVLTMVPAVAATDSQPDTITLPNGEVREIPTLDASIPMVTSVSALDQDSEGYYLIKNETDFGSVLTNEWYANYKFRITSDLNLAGCFEEEDEWVGAITYFRGTLEGVLGDYDEDGNERYPIISGIPENCCLIYGIIGGTIENLTFKYDGQAAFITMMPINYGTNNYPLILRNVTTTGSVTLTGSDQSNYSPFVYSASPGGLQMYYCTNDATINGPIYGSVFHGYSAYVGSTYVFDHCVNNKNVTLNYAGMFFGNSSNLESRLSQISLTITDCVNNAEIRGVQGAKYLSAPVGADYTAGSNLEKVESLLNSGIDTVAGAATAYPNIKAITGTGKLLSTADDVDFYAKLDGESIEITHSENVASYVVAVGAYVNMWFVDSAKFDGTDRVSVTETINATEISDGAVITATLKAYGFADSDFGYDDDPVLDYPVRYKDGSLYYAVDNEILYYDDTVKHYVSNVAESGVPVGGGSKTAQFITVSAYDVSGNFVGFISLR